VRAMLMLSDREEISRGLAVGLEFKEIGLRLGRDPSVISREVDRHVAAGAIEPLGADTVARAARQRPKLLAVEPSARLRAVVRRQLRGGWSPASIAGRLPSTIPTTTLAGPRRRRSTSGSMPSRCPPWPGS